MANIVRYALFTSLVLVANVALGQPPSADQIWAELGAGNQRFIAGKPVRHDSVARRAQLVKAQSPSVAVLGCSDSRVSPELLFDEGLGDLFVIRNAGNTPDAIDVGSLEYAVEHFGIKVIVVLGHMSCGAVEAACSGEKPATPNLAAVVDPIAPSCAMAKHGDAIDLSAAVKDHVHRSAQQLVATSAIIKAAVAKGTVTVIEAYYELDTGKVVRLK
jgi:carbonic anhydrase